MSILGALIEPVAGIIGKLVPDKDQANRLAHEIATLAERQHHEAMVAQLEVNKAEAGHSSIFVSGWRPFVGWVCGTSIAFNFIGLPLLEAAGVDIAPLELTTMMPVLLGMLGLGGMRSFEKRHGVNKH